MKKKISFFLMMLFCVMMLAFVINSCKKSSIEPQTSSAVTPSAVTSSDPKSLNLTKVNYNLNVILRGVSERDDQGEDHEGDREGDHMLGHIKFRQDKDTPKIVSLDVWVRGLEPNHSYQLQRAVDTNLDGNCTGTAWLTLGKGLTPQSIVTDSKGMGQEDLWRDVSSVPSGSTFDIHFQIIDELTSAVVLTSDCYQYTVR
jgi:hypothetical protein